MLRTELKRNSAVGEVIAGPPMPLVSKVVLAPVFFSLLNRPPTVRLSASVNFQVPWANAEYSVLFCVNTREFAAFENRPAAPAQVATELQGEGRPARNSPMKNCVSTGMTR